MGNTEATNDVEPPPLGTVFELAARRRRRVALDCLSDHGPLALSDLAARVAGREQDVPLSEISDDARRRVHVSLWHNHVPKLADAGVVELDRERKIVTLTDEADAVERVLRLADPDREAHA